MSKARLLCEEVERRLAGVAGLSADVIRWGAMQPAGGSVPMVSLGIGPVETEQAPELGRWQRTMTIQIVAQVAGEDATARSRVFAGLDMANLIAEALERDRNTQWMGSAVQLRSEISIIDLSVSFSGMDGDEVGYAGVGLAAVEFRVWWYADSEAGI